MSAKNIVMAAAGNTTTPTYVDDVFSTYLYPGTQVSKTITTGVDLTGWENTTDQVAYTSTGTYTWVCPPGVTSVSVVCVGSGGSGNNGVGGGGGGLGWKNNISVTPGNTYTVVVGSPGNDSYFISAATVRGGGGIPGDTNTPGVGGTYAGDGGGNGGNGGAADGGSIGGGGGAGGYQGNGGNGGNDSLSWTAGSGGAGAGGVGSSVSGWTGGGGVGILGRGTSGTSNGQGGSGGTNGSTQGGQYGGGGYGAGGGSTGAVRIIYPGNTRLFPSTNTGNVTPSGGNPAKGGLIWFKSRSSITSTVNYLLDTVRGGSFYLSSNTNGANATTGATYITSFTSNGFLLSSNANLNGASDIYASWTFRKAAKFFDIVTYTGDGTTNRAISHSLSISPGMIILKATSASSSWFVYSRGFSSPTADFLRLEGTSAKETSANFWGASGPSASQFFVSLGSNTNTNGTTYIAYLFAHDTAADGLTQCGSFTASGTGSNVNLGWEPQFVLYKRSDSTGNWTILDIARGYNESGTDETLFANASSSAAYGQFGKPFATGFQEFLAAGTYIYMAIRRPNKPPTTGTQVFQPTVYTGTNANNRLVNTTIAPDMVWIKQRDLSNDFGGMVVGDRLRGQPYLLTGSTAAEVTSATALDQQIVSTTEYGTAFSSMTGFYVGTDATTKLNVNTTASNHVALAFKRAPGFFDMVCYAGTGVARTVAHNLGVVPELILVKRRSLGGGQGWNVYAASLGNSSFITLNTSQTPFTGQLVWNNTTPTSSVFYVNSDAEVNSSSYTYVAYLFATLPGISKVGSYTGNGSVQTINCGFSTGARFILIKRTDSSGDWRVWDSARGIVAGNDPYLPLNTAAVEETNYDTIDPNTSGFVVNQGVINNINVSLATYIYLAIA